MLVILTADTSGVARLNKDLMPQQTLMELLVQAIDHKEVFQDRQKRFWDIASWEKVQFQDSCVVDIDWMVDPIGFGWGDEFLDAIEDTSPVQPGGSMDLQWIPNTVLHFNISSLELHGTVETCSLPPTLITFLIDSNKFWGTFDVSALPETLRQVSVFHNNLSGSLGLKKLPPKLTGFNAGNNKFSGEINLASLPSSLTSLLLNANEFVGSVNLQSVPINIKVIYLHENNFCQTEIRIRTDLKCLAPLKLDKDSFEALVDCDGEHVPGVKHVLNFAEVVIRK